MLLFHTLLSHEILIFLITLFIFFCCAGSLLLHGLFSSFKEWGLLSSCGVKASHCGGFSCCGAGVWGTQASVVAAHSLSHCGSRLERTGSVVVTYGLGCPAACGIFQDQHVGSSWTRDRTYVSRIGRQIL